MLGLLGSLLEDNSLKQQGFWDASTNTPTLVNGTGVQGYYYVVSVGGTVNFGAGNIAFTTGDWVYYNTANQWVKFETGVDYIPVNKAGDTMTGALLVPEVIVGDAGTEGSGINIGGVTYESSFKVSDIDGTNYAQTILHRHSTALEPLIIGARSNSDTSAHADVTAGQNVFSIYGAGWLGSNYKLFGSSNFSADSTGTLSNTSSPGKFSINITPNGALIPVEVLKISSKGELTAKTQAHPIANLTDAATVAVDFSLADTFRLIATSAVGATRQIDVPTNVIEGKWGGLIYRQDSAGSRALTWAWCYIFPQGIAPTASIFRRAVDFFKFEVLKYVAPAEATVKIANPCVVTQVEHGHSDGSIIAFTATTGALPTGLALNTPYWVDYIGPNSYRLFATKAASDANTPNVITTGSQSGVHTVTGLEILVGMNANNGR
jgi:hypothetical protein